MRDPNGTPIVWVGSIPEFFSSYLHVDVSRKLRPLDWLILPQQKLLSVVRGPIYHDLIGLERTRSRLVYFPRDVWLHLLAAQWSRIAEEEAFAGRAGAVRDELGARVITARQVREVVRLAFFQERRYIPYSKWLGTAFRGLRIAPILLPPLLRALEATEPLSRERALSRAYEVVARKQNSLRLTISLPVQVSRFHDRPYRIIHAGGFAKIIRASIRDRRLCSLGGVGSVDQWANTEEIGSKAQQLGALRALAKS
ncbi:MAG TPA: DUF4037 domain-containing protein [Thermoplasmata archaeon]|nr:DUF4037 domain-containing protein [Thermoplasmata archaeon]